MTAHEEILARVRRAKASADETRPADYAHIPRPYNQRGGLDLEGRLRLLTERLEDYDAVVYRCAVSELPSAIAKAMAARGKSSLVASPSLPSAWLPDESKIRRDYGLSHSDLDGSEGSLTGCAVAVANTGTIILTHEFGEARRALTLIPDYHLCVVFAEQVVETVPEGLRRVGSRATAPITTISGPSATADIEMTRIKGVHGPRSFDVILVLS